MSIDIKVILSRNKKITVDVVPADWQNYIVS